MTGKERAEEATEDRTVIADSQVQQFMHDDSFPKGIGDGQIQGYEYKEPFPTLLAWAGSNKGSLVSQEGFEPTTKRLRVSCSTAELLAPRNGTEGRAAP